MSIDEILEHMKTVRAGNVKELKAIIADLPDEMELVGESGEGQEEIFSVEVCRWINNGMYYTDEEKERLDPSRTKLAERPQLRIKIKY